jgi:hypothetical protein
MIPYVMLIWIGMTLNAPTWYWWCLVIGFIVKFISFGFDMFKAGRG